jgi:predicted nucleotidyltransferase
VESLVKALAARPEVARIWLYGSRARGDARERSDVDLAVEAPEAGRRAWLSMCDLAEDADTLLPIDLVRVEEAPAALRERIRREGRVLYER